MLQFNSKHMARVIWKPEKLKHLPNFTLKAWVILGPCKPGVEGVIFTRGK